MVTFNSDVFMKKIGLMLLLSVLLVACNDKNKSAGFLAPVTNVKATSFIGSVILTWENPVDANLYYVLISYVNGHGEMVQKKVDRYATDDEGKTGAIIGGFTDTNEYGFTLTAHAYDGSVSEPVRVTGIPSSTSEAKDYVLKTVSVKPAVSGAKISWTNRTGVGVILTVAYTDYKQRPQTVRIDAGNTGSRIVYGMQESTKLRITATNKDGGESTEAESFDVTPEIDPDDLIQEGVDYVTFDIGAKNQLDVAQDNPDNPYEYVFTTSGGDPFVPCKGMPNPVKGTVLVFRYQAVSAFALELFWCNAGGGAAGGRSTTVTVPAAPEGEWATFRHDYASDMSQHAWKGSTGDFMRFDLGNKPALTIRMKNIHFE